MYEPFYRYLLQNFPDFQLDPTIFNRYLETKVLSKGEILFQVDDASPSVGFILQGCVRIFIFNQDRERTISFHTEHDSFGDFRSFLKQQPATFNCEAIEPTKALILHRDALSFLESLPNGNQFLRFHAESFAAKMQDKLVSLFLDTPEERYRHLLATEADLLARLPNYHLANYLGIQPESLSRLKRRLYHQHIS